MDRTQKFQLIFVLIIIVLGAILFTLLTPRKTSISELQKTAQEILGLYEEYPGSYVPMGMWVRQCDTTHVVRYTWEAELELSGGTILVEVSFIGIDDVPEKMRMDPLVFKLSPDDPSLWLDWLWIDDDWRLRPDHIVGDSYFLSEYPGGYKQFEKDIESLGINWEELYSLLWQEWTLRFDPDSCIDFVRPTPTPAPTKCWDCVQA